MGIIRKWARRARSLKSDLYILYMAYRDPRVPWYAKALAAAVVAYAFSPVDLVPDFIPVVGYLDDLVLIPLGIGLAVRMIPPTLLDEFKARSNVHPVKIRAARLIIIIVVIFWVALIMAAVYAITRIIFSSGG